MIRTSSMPASREVRRGHEAPDTAAYNDEMAMLFAGCPLHRSGIGVVGVMRELPVGKDIPGIMVETNADVSLIAMATRELGLIKIK
jgi:hypothetical protein